MFSVHLGDGKQNDQEDCGGSLSSWFKVEGRSKGVLEISHPLFVNETIEFYYYYRRLCALDMP